MALFATNLSALEPVTITATDNGNPNATIGVKLTLVNKYTGVAINPAYSQEIPNIKTNSLGIFSAEFNPANWNSIALSSFPGGIHNAAVRIETKTGAEYKQIATLAIYPFYQQASKSYVDGVKKQIDKLTLKLAFKTLSLPELIEAGYSTQELLDNGITPKQIYDKSNQYLDSLYGKTYAGGLIFHFDITTGKGLVAAPSDQGQAPWGCMSIDIGGTRLDIGLGQANTATIVGSSCSDYDKSAKICDNLVLNGYNDWFLPSKDELIAMYDNLKAKGFGSFKNLFYCSSSEDSAWSSWGIHFQSRYIDAVNKNTLCYVRAVREF